MSKMERGDSTESLISLANNVDVSYVYDRINPLFSQFKSWFLKVAYNQLKQILEDYLKNPTINV